MSSPVSTRDGAAHFSNDELNRGNLFYIQNQRHTKERVRSVTRPDLIELLKADKPDLVAELDTTIIELLKKVGDE